MSGNVTEQLREPIIYPNWMWVVGVVILVAVLGWVAYCLWRWWTSRVGEVSDLYTLSEARRRKYESYLEQIHQRYLDGELDMRGLHLAIAGLMRALGTERTGRDLEVATVEEVRALAPTWSALIEVLSVCEDNSFSKDTHADAAFASEPNIPTPEAAPADEADVSNAVPLAQAESDAAVNHVLLLAHQAVAS